MYILYKKNKYKELACMRNKEAIKIFQKEYKKQFNIISYVKKLKGGEKNEKNI